jgi:hypothetical protein
MMHINKDRQAFNDNIPVHSVYPCKLNIFPDSIECKK